jgi:hypothetical protein
MMPFSAPFVGFNPSEDIEAAAWVPVPEAPRSKTGARLCALSCPGNTDVTSRRENARVMELSSDADVTELLLLEFEATHGLRLVSAMIRICRAELRKSAPGYTPESLEALVRSRLPTGHSASLGAA